MMRWPTLAKDKDRSMTKSNYRNRLLLIACSVILTLPVAEARSDEDRPKLILQITVDQLRGDLPGRYLDRMGEGGFQYLFNKGVVYANAHHAHANTETVVGHTTLATGAQPAVHGMIGNVWFDRGSGEMIYNVQDKRYGLLTQGADVDKASEIDPTQKVATTDGRSPSVILVSTFGDELAISTAGKAKVFGVSVKDRGAISMAGHAGKAFWFSKAAQQWITSEFYYENYPDWVTAFNEAEPAKRFGDTAWELSNDRSTYLFGDRDDQEWEVSIAPFGRVFPHPYGPADGRGFSTFLTLSPAGDELTLDFTKALIENENIGADAITDYLSVSFSSTDYVGHVFGPSSLESEENLLRLDRTLAALFEYIDKKVGLDNTLIVLSADHGGPEAPPDLQRYGFESQYVEPENWEKEAAFEALKTQFGIAEPLIRQYSHPYLYLNRELIAEKGLSLAEVETAVAAELVKFEGVALAISSTAMTEGRLPDTPLMRSVLNNYNPRRSGEIYIVFAPNWFINDFDGLEVAATHGSPWRYDTYVPVIFAGGGLEPQKIYREVHTTDVAPTLAAIAGSKPPSGTRGKVLVEVMDNQ